MEFRLQAEPNRYSAFQRKLNLKRPHAAKKGVYFHTTMNSMLTGATLLKAISGERLQLVFSTMQPLKVFTIFQAMSGPGRCRNTRAMNTRVMMFGRTSTKPELSGSCGAGRGTAIKTLRGPSLVATTVRASVAAIAVFEWCWWVVPLRKAVSYTHLTLPTSDLV